MSEANKDNRANRARLVRRVSLVSGANKDKPANQIPIANASFVRRLPQRRWRVVVNLSPAPQGQPVRLVRRGQLERVKDSRARQMRRGKNREAAMGIAVAKAVESPGRLALAAISRADFRPAAPVAAEGARALMPRSILQLNQI